MRAAQVFGHHEVMHLVRGLSIGLVLVALGRPVGAERLAVPGGGFEREAEGAAAFGVESSGDVRRVAQGDGHALRIGDGATAALRFEGAALRSVDGVAADGWYTVVAVDVLEREAEAQLALRVDGVEVAAVEVQGAEVGGRALRTRLFARLSTDGAAGGRLELTASGGALVVDTLEVERHHAAPGRELCGKENGFDGPDQVACGALGFDALAEHEHRALAVMRVRQGGLAAAAGLARGDLVVAVDGELLAHGSLAAGRAWFERGHEATLGRALERAALAGRAHVALTVLRADGLATLALAQPFTTERFGAALPRELAHTFPLTGAAADALRADLVAFALRTQRADGSWPGAPEVNTPLGGLALLGTGDAAMREHAARALTASTANFPSPSQMKGLAYWAIAFHGWLACEWRLATGDAAPLGWVREAIQWLPSTTHRSAFGMPAFGHGPEGLPYDDQALMAPAAHLLVFDALARRCGIESGVWEHIEPYVVHSWSDPASGGHGGMGYNGSYKDEDEFWSRSGLVALAEVLRGDEETGMAGPLTALMQERHPWMLNSHAYGEPGGALGLLALSVANPRAFDAVLPQWRWRFLCAWEPGHGLRYSSPHMGAPYMAEEVVVNLAYLLLLSTRERSLAMAGRARADDAPLR
jgi:hypothetical protein